MMLSGFPSAVSIDEFQRHLYTNYLFNLLIACYWKDTPQLFTINNVDQFASLERHSHFTAIGRGADLARYLLQEHSQPNQSAGMATAVAIYVVEQVKRYIDGCAGRTQVGVVRHFSEALRKLAFVKPENAFLLSGARVDAIASKLSDLDAQMQRARSSAVRDMLEGIATEEEKMLQETFKKYTGADFLMGDQVPPP